MTILDTRRNEHSIQTYSRVKYDEHEALEAEIANFLKNGGKITDAENSENPYKFAIGVNAAIETQKAKKKPEKVSQDTKSIADEISSRRAAMLAGEKFYNGRPCLIDNTTLKYTSSAACLACISVKTKADYARKLEEKHARI